MREGLVNREHVVAIFFHLEKAYDTSWKYGILSDLFKAGLRGHLTNFISNFLENRQFKVRIGSTLPALRAGDGSASGQYTLSDLVRS